MTAPLSSFSGLASGIQWQDLITQIIASESVPSQRVRARVSTNSSKIDSFRSYKTLLDTLRGAARKLRDGSAFDGMTASAVITAGTRQVASASASAGANQASYRLEVSSLAAQQKLSATTQPSDSVALGLSGTIKVNGLGPITIGATDSLADIRDHIAAINTGATPSKVSASIISIGASSHRLVLTSDTAGSAGMTLEDVSGNVLQSLGLLSNATTIAPAAVLQAGTDAQFKIDGVSFTRTSNTVTDALTGVTLQLLASEPGAVTTISVDRSATSAKSAMQDVVDAYNKVVDFLKAQGSTDTQASSQPVLYNESLLRVARGALPSTLLTTIGNAASDLNTAGLAGLSLQKDGKLLLDSTKFDAAFSGRLSDVRTLFQQQGSAAGTGLSFLASPTSVEGGTYAVDITTAATQATVTGTDLVGGIYSDDATPDTMTVTDGATGKVATVTLTDGMTSTQIRDALNAAFTAQGLGLTAAETGGQVSLTQSLYGAGATFTVAYTAGGAASTTLPIAAGTYAGVDVAGTINGELATGSGQILVGASATSVAGLSVQYEGTATGAVGTTTLSQGTGALLERLLDSMTDTTSGLLSKKETSLLDQNASLTRRADDMEARLERRRALLVRQFSAMEQAISKLQSNSSSIIASLNALQNGSNN